MWSTGHSRLADTLSVPLEAIFESPEGRVVYVAGPDGFRVRRVEIGERNDEGVVITKGLAPGKRVALSDPTQAEEE